MAGTVPNTLRTGGLPKLVSPGWSVALGLTLVAMLAVAVVHQETALSIARIWARSETYAHGWLILPLSAWLVWRRRAFLARLDPRVCWSGLVALAALEFVWIAASIADVVFARQFALVAMLPAIVLVMLGPRVTRSLAFPLAYLVFAVPWGEELVPMLQDITAYMSVALLDLSGIPVYWEGRMISIPVGDFHVAEACSGVRYLIASLALGTLYAYLTYRSQWRRAAFIAAAIAVPIVANGLRAYGIIMLAHFSDMRLATGVDHLIYGWIFFGLVMFLLFWIGSFWRERAEGPADTNTDRKAPGGVTTPLPARACAGLAVVALTVAASLVPDWSARAQPVPSTEVVFPNGSAGWSADAAREEPWIAGFAGADEIRQQVFRSTAFDEPVRLLVVHYRNEGQGAELINSQNRLQGDAWQWLGGQRRALVIGDRERDLRELRIARGADKRMIWSWYDIGGRQTTSASVAKGFAALLRLTGRAGDATLVAVATDYEDEPGAARQRLETFLAAHAEVLAPRGLIEER